MYSCVPTGSGGAASWQDSFRAAAAAAATEIDGRIDASPYASSSRALTSAAVCTAHAECATSSTTNVGILPARTAAREVANLISRSIYKL